MLDVGGTDASLSSDRLVQQHGPQFSPIIRLREHPIGVVFPAT